MQDEVFKKLLNHFPSEASIIQKGKIVVFNDQFCASLGYSPKELVDIKVSELIHPEETKDKLALFENNQAGEIALKMIKKDGIKLTKRISLENIQYNNQPGLLWVWYKDSIPFNRICENSNNLAVKGINCDHQIIYWNSACESIFGYSRDEALGQKLESLIVPEHLRNKIAGDCDKWINGNKEMESSKQIWSNREGDDVKVFSNYVLVENDAGEKLGFIIDVDITELDGLDQHYWQIQRLKSIGKLSAGIAEKFNNILSVIKGRTQISMMKIDENQEGYKNLDEILEASDRANELNKKLLLFSRKKEMRFRPIDMNEIVRYVIKMMNDRIDSNIDINTEYRSDLWKINGDLSYLEDAIMNLLVNSQEALSEEGKISVKTDNVSIDKNETGQDLYISPGNYTRLIIKDTGTGIHEKDINKIFDPFFTTKNEAESDGLGLSVVYGIVKKHRGWINVKSTPDEGTTFIIDIPAYGKN
jgi:PAS domain S-box-containing protein